MTRIYIVGEINDEAFEKFSKALDNAESIKTVRSVEVVLSSYGGDAASALAFYGRIRGSRLEIKIRAYGLVASAAVLILAAGDYRTMHNTAWVMVHEDSGRINGTVTRLEAQVRQSRVLETQWNKLMAQMTNATSEYWEKLHKAETYLTAHDCLKSNLIDEII